MAMRGGLGEAKCGDERRGEEEGIDCGVVIG
jgi:hypothetical protein